MIRTDQFERKDTLPATEENIYYNVKIFNPFGAPLPTKAEYSSNKVVPIVENPRDYKMGVIRFNIPANFPLFIFPEFPEAYEIRLRWKTNTVSRYVTYTDPCTGCPYPRGIYHYQQMLDLINNRIEEMRVELLGLDPTFPSTNKIFLYFNPETSLFSLYVESAFGASPDFNLEMNGELYLTYFPTFVVDRPTNPFELFKFRIENDALNLTTIGATSYFKVTQEEPSLGNWTQFSLLVFETSMPVSGELEADDKNVKNSVLTDFSLTGVSQRDFISYYPQGPIRYYDIDTDYPLRRVDMKIYVTYPDGLKFPLVLNAGDAVTLKLHFRKKRF
jgi:hypothetical protein